MKVRGNMEQMPPAGPYGGIEEENFSRFRDSAANAAWFHGFDEEMFERTTRAGKAACVEFKTFRADFAAHPDLVPIGVDGAPIRFGRLVQGVCLSREWFIQERMDALVRGMDAFQPAGVWLDYLTYGGWFETPEPDLQESCFCTDCIADFCEASGVDAEEPEVILSSYRNEWTRRKVERISEFARAFAGIIKGRNPDCIVGAYMCPWRPDEFDGALSRIFAQDYDALATVVDVFTPLLYARKCGRPSSWSRSFLEGCHEFIPGHREVQLILDYLDFPAGLEEAARVPALQWGVQVFGGNRIFSSSDATDIFNTCVTTILKTS